MAGKKNAAFAVMGAMALTAVPIMAENRPGEVWVSLAEWLPFFYATACILLVYAGFELGRRAAGQTASPGAPVQAASDAGLMRSYANREEARAEIDSAVHGAAFIKILSNKGDEWLSTTGMIVAPLTERAARGERVPVKLLLLHPNAPWLLGRAAEKGFWRRERAQVLADFIAAHDRVLGCRPTPEVEPAHFHRHDPSWRFLMTDRTLFLQSYATNAQINNETVLQFSYKSPIYASAARHFDYLYELDSAERDQISPLEAFRQKAFIHETSAGLILTRDCAGQRSILVLWNGDKYWLSKGHVEAGEELLDAARRELLEETGVSPDRGRERFAKCVMVGQPFYDSASLKTIAFYHLHLGLDLDVGSPNQNARWVDAEQLSQLTPRYAYVPELVALVGMNRSNAAGAGD